MNLVEYSILIFSIFLNILGLVFFIPIPFVGFPIRFDH